MFLNVVCLTLLDGYASQMAVGHTNMMNECYNASCFFKCTLNATRMQQTQANIITLPVQNRKYRHTDCNAVSLENLVIVCFALLLT